MGMPVKDIAEFGHFDLVIIDIANNMRIKSLGYLFISRGYDIKFGGGQCSLLDMYG